MAEPANEIIRRSDIQMIRWEQSIDNPGRWVFRSEGRTLVVPADLYERIIRATVQGDYKAGEEVLLEAVETGVVEVTNDNNKH